MTNVLIYDVEAEILEDMAIKNDLSIADIVELLTEKLEDIKAENNLI